jgi:hypothetical protein
VVAAAALALLLALVALWTAAAACNDRVRLSAAGADGGCVTGVRGDAGGASPAPPELGAASAGGANCGIVTAGGNRLSR